MKLSHIFLLLSGLFTFISCSEIREATESIAGDITEYQTTYTFQTDRMSGSDYLNDIESYMRSNDWLLTNDEENTLRFEQTTGEFEENTTRRFEDGSADFHYDEDREIIELNLRLRGNYNYGTKQNSLEVYNDIRDSLYENE